MTVEDCGYQLANGVCIEWNDEEILVKDFIYDDTLETWWVLLENYVVRVEKLEFELISDPLSDFEKSLIIDELLRCDLEERFPEKTTESERRQKGAEVKDSGGNANTCIVPHFRRKRQKIA